MKKNLKLEIEISNIEVEDGYYSFDYVYTLNGKKKKKSYDSGYEGWTEKEWKNELEKGEAVNIALQQIAENNI